MDEIVRKRKLKSQAGRRAALDEQQLVEETTTLHRKFNLFLLNYSLFSQRKRRLQWQNFHGCSHVHRCHTST